ncbi:TOMM precursor leader peptide-binding protein [Streptomyces sp. NPDC001068]|uniref:TOMM precursor leader peptide-binding protein n=1 Tax=Streptomyces sp. NPDC001068 TaxID=3364544 RepID=UPI0036964C3E
MPTETVAPRAQAGPAAADPAAGPWEAVCADLAAAVDAALAGRAGRHPGTPRAVVTRLGVRDELASEAADFAPDTVPVGLYGHHAVVGPRSAVAGQGCPQCLARRWQAVRAGFLRDALELGGEPVATGTPPWRVAFVADALAALAAFVAASAGVPESGRHPWVWLLDLETLRVSRFPLVPDGECPTCGTPTDDTADGARIVLESAPKHAPDSFRQRPPDAYGLTPAAFANPVTGVLGPSVAPDLTSASTSSAIGAFTTRSGSYLRECYWGGHTDAYGTSVGVGLLEGLERFAGMRARSKRTTVTASLDELRARGAEAVDPRTTGLYSDAFHAADPDVPRFVPDRPVEWVWGWSLRDARPVLVPEVVAYYHAPGGIGRRFVQESSNGCASGGSLTEAVYHGLMETVERDAFLLSWFGRVRLPEIDPASSTQPETRAMVDRLAMYGYRARFFDTRITFPVPVVTAVAERVDGGQGLLCFGAGASLDPEAALASGLCEIATDSVNLRRRTAREERRLRRMAADFHQVRVLHDHPLLYGLPEMGPYTDFLLRGRDDSERVPLASLAPGHGPGAPLASGHGRGVPITSGYGPGVPVTSAHGPDSPVTAAPRSGMPLTWGPGPAASGPGRPRTPGASESGVPPVRGDLRDDVAACVAAVAARGFDVVVVDQTAPEQRSLGLSTVKVLVPGLLPIDFGWSRQRGPLMPRARTALREAGLRPDDLTDGDLNPAPHPFP